MDRPLWQILLSFAVVGFVARHAAIGLATKGDDAQAILGFAYVGLCVVCGLSAALMLLGRRSVITALIALAAGYTLAMLVELTASAHPQAAVIAQWALGMAGCAALLVMTLRNTRTSKRAR